MQQHLAESSCECINVMQPRGTLQSYLTSDPYSWWVLMVGMAWICYIGAEGINQLCWKNKTHSFLLQIANMEVLETLEVSGSSLTTLPVFPYNPHLTRLFLNENSIKSIPSGVFSELPNLVVSFQPAPQPPLLLWRWFHSPLLHSLFIYPNVGILGIISIESIRVIHSFSDLHHAWLFCMFFHEEISSAQKG